MSRRANRQVSAAMAEAAAEALQTLLDAERILESAKPVGLPALVSLLALKAGPAYPRELASVLGVPPARVRQRLLRLRSREATSHLLRALPDGRYRLSLKGHRFANETAAVARQAKYARRPSRL